MTFSSSPETHALEGISTQTSCVDNQPCHTIVCSEGQPCKVSETPNTDFDSDTANIFPQPLEGTGIMGLVPNPDPYNNDYLDDQEEYLEERQDMMEDTEYE